MLNAILIEGGNPAVRAAEQFQNDPGAMTAVGSAAVAATGTQVMAVGSSRLAALRTGDAFASSQASGFAAGDGELAKALWFKPFANLGDQNSRYGISGFRSRTYGAAFGGDIKVDRSTYGVSFSYAYTGVDSKGTGNAQTDIASYQGTFYADYTSDSWYIEGMAGYARNQIRTSRVIDFASVSANADYGSNQFMFSIGGGMPVEIAENHFVTPNASFQYTLVENETYTEEGAANLNLRVDQDEIHIALGVFGLRYHTNTNFEGGTLTPELRGGIIYDFAADDGVATNIFNGGGAAFYNQGQDVVAFGFQAGAGLSYQPKPIPIPFTSKSIEGLSLSANYDVLRKEDFVGHSANFAIRYEF